MNEAYVFCEHSREDHANDSANSVACKHIQRVINSKLFLYSNGPITGQGGDETYENAMA